MVFNITDFGAVADGKTLNTKALQSAIDKCSAAGGGTVTVPSGTYKTGTIYMRSNVELHLEHGSLLLASEDLNDYNPPDAYPQNWSSDKEQWNKCHLIIAAEIENASITGSGTIDGSADAFYAETPDYYGDFGWRYGIRTAKDKKLLRPGQMVIFVECKDVAVSGIKLNNSTCWTLVFHGCENVKATGLTIKNKIYHSNTDGIDIDCCRNVVVSDCNITTGDDGLTLRGDCNKLLDKTRVCENIAISNCVITTGVCGMRIGVGTGTIRNAVISNLSIGECGIGIQIQSIYNKANNNGVDISELTFSNIRCADSVIPVMIESGSDMNTAAIKNITFNNCSFVCSYSTKINGGGKCIPTNIIFNNIDFRVIDSRFGLRHNPNPEYFFMLNNAKDVLFNNVRLHWEIEKDTHWIENLSSENVENLQFKDCDLPQPNTKK